MKNIACMVLVGFAVLLPQQTRACTIPVFRYALEKWDLTPYEIMIFHRGPLAADVEKALKKWENAPKDANIEVTRIDLGDKLTKSQQRIWDKEGNDKQTPWLIVRYAAADPMEASSWTGPCSVANMNSVLDSPMRRAVLAHLTRGASTVFIVMTGDDAVKDRAALDMMTRELAKLEKGIKLPMQSDTGPQIKLPIPLKVSFPILVLDRNQPEEAAFVRLLLGTEDRLADVKGTIVFPIFGRGRVLGSLIGDEYRPDQLVEVAKFLCRECSCQVKELNPGIDMLISANWPDLFDQLYDGKEPILMPPLSPAYLTPRKVVAPAPPKVEEQTSVEWKSAPIDTQIVVAQNRITPSVQAPAEERAERTPINVRFLIWLGIGAASGLVLLSGGWVVYQVRK